MNRTAPTSSIWLVIAMAPVIAVSDLATHAVALGIASFIVCITAGMIGWLLRSTQQPVGTVLLILCLAALTSVIGLWMGAGAYELRSSLGVFLPLLAINLAIVWLVDPVQHSSFGSALRTAIARGGLMMVIVVALGVARELVGRGSLFHTAGDALGSWARVLNLQLFPADMGFLLAMLPPGAFIAFGLLLAARNWLTNRHRHEPRQDR